MKKNHLVGMAMLLLGSMAVFAQGTGEQSASASSGKKQEVRVMIWSSSYDEKIGPYKVEELFEEAHPEYDVVFDKIDYDELDKQTLLEHTTGNDYDVIMVNHSSLPSFVKGGVLQPFDSFLADNSVDLSGYPQKAVKAGTIDGKIYGIPFDPDCRILAYNTKILKEIGEEPPKTTDDMMRIARKAYKAGYYAMAGALNRQTFCVYDLGGFMLCWGIQLYEEDENGKYVCMLNTPEAVDYMKWAQEMYQYMPHDANMDNTLARSMFAQGKIAMMWWTPSQIKSVIPQFANREDLDFSLMPTGPTGATGSGMGGYMWGIGSGAKNPEGAWAFISWALQPENQGKIARGLPSDPKAFDYEPFNIPDYDVFREELPNAMYPCPLTPVLPKIFETWNRTYSECLMNQITPEEACEKGYKEVQEILDTL